MRADGETARRVRFGFAALAGLAVAGAAVAGPPRASSSSGRPAEGKALFRKVWTPGEPSPRGGDGLGPLFNERSCAACHFLGGLGGAGPRAADVTLLVLGSSIERPVDWPNNRFVGEPEELYPGLRGRSSVVLHAHSTDPNHAMWWQLRVASHSAVEAKGGTRRVSTARRNTPALFGAGRIDAIPDDVIWAAQERRFPEFPEIGGRVSPLANGRVGRFGWKGQTATLREFVLGACSTELGLEVPGHHQHSITPGDDPSRNKLDLDEADCADLTAFVAALAPPRRRRSGGWPVLEGGALFASIGCATCHAPRLGTVEGIYSDLLLHDLGDRMSAGGFGYGGGSGSIVDRAPSPGTPADDAGAARATEWRTPPLWGVLHSAPYLHDGRASTLDRAIRFHGGEAAATSDRYSRLRPSERRALLHFLATLGAPVGPPPRRG